MGDKSLHTEDGEHCTLTDEIQLR